MTTLPSDLTYGKVIGRFVLALGDGPDSDTFPEGEPAEGSITISAALPFRRADLDEPLTILPQPITCGLDEDGYLIDLEGQQGVWLVTGHYRVAYDLDPGGVSSHDIVVTEDHTEESPLDLTRDRPSGPVSRPSQYAELSARLNEVKGDAEEAAQGAADIAAQSAAEAVRDDIATDLSTPGTPAYDALVDAAGNVTDPQTASLVNDTESATRGAIDGVIANAAPDLSGYATRGEVIDTYLATDDADQHVSSLIEDEQSQTSQSLDQHIAADYPSKSEVAATYLPRDETPTVHVGVTTIEVVNDFRATATYHFPPGTFDPNGPMPVVAVTPTTQFYSASVTVDTRVAVSITVRRIRDDNIRSFSVPVQVIAIQAPDYPA